MGEKNDKTLTLLHLRKTFSEYNRISVSGAKEIDPNRLLPLFKNVSSMYNPVELRTEFKEAPSFALYFAGFFVREVRTRASTDGTEEAAILIADYLIPSSNAHRGYSILSALYFLLLSDDDAIVDSLCKASLPSTIVKSLYLFFDLPSSPELHVELLNQLNELLTSLLKRLCTYKAVSEELTKKDDLALLFLASSSSVRQENIMWRKTCSRCLETLAARSLSPLVIKYIIDKECIKSYLLNVQQQELKGQEGADIIMGLFAVLKDSSTISNALSDSFSTIGGYEYLRQFILANESDEEMVRSVISMLIPLMTNGPQEIKPQVSSGLVCLPSFVLPSPHGPGLSVRNTHPLLFLFNLFIESSSSSTCISIVDVIQSVYSYDHSNYFIIDRFVSLSSFIERLSGKDMQVQIKVLEIVEFVLFQLQYIPCKELIAICVLTKIELNIGRTEFPIAFSHTSFKLLTIDPLVKDAFREVGLLDTLSYCIFHLYNTSKNRELSESENKLALLTTDLLTVTIKGNSENGKLFGETRGPTPLLDLLVGVENSEWRSSSLQLLKQLLLLSPSDVYISSLLSSIIRCILPKDLSLISQLLKSLLGVLRESHKVRILFRRCGGYVCLVSLMLSLEGTLSTPSIQSSSSLSSYQSSLLDFINLIFKVITISMRFEPSNAKFFCVEVNWESVTTVLRLSGAFTNNTQLNEDNELEIELRPLLSLCHDVFRMDENVQMGVLPSGMPPMIFYECYLIRILFNMALDNYEKQASNVSFSSDTSLEDAFISWTSCVIVHPGAIISILQLIPSIHIEDTKWTLAAQLYTTLLVKSILRLERNQQMMCQMDMPRHLLSICSNLFLLNNHVLHPHLYYLLERLSYQSMQPSQLRQFLRLDLPLCCRNLDETKGESVIKSSEGGPIPLTRVKALVSMMTPRDERLSHTPSFIEFDMMHEGFGCLFIPSLSPQIESSNRSQRLFPPLNGLTYSFWIYIDSFSDKKVDCHPIRLLTITRASSSQQRPQYYSSACLTVQLSSIDRSLLISTDEYENPGCDLDKDCREGNKFPSDKIIRIPLVDRIREQDWTHFCIVLTRSVLKQSQLSVYLNGRLIGTHKMQYIVQNAGGGSSQLATTHAVNATIGTTPLMRRPSRLRWRLSSVFLIEDPITSDIVSKLYSLQPHYIGNLQTVGIDESPIIPEDKIIVSLNGAAVDELTIAKIRGLYSKLDAEMTSGLLGLNPSDNSTPLRILLNASTHSYGSGRSFGAVIVGYLGMRTFCPRAVPRLLDSIGGYNTLYALVAMSTDSESLYASLKAIVSAVRSNANLYHSINSNRAYQMLGVLIEDKGHLLNSHIVNLIFSLTGTLDTIRDGTRIPNIQAFEDLLADLDIWNKGSDDIHRMLYEHIYELITDERRGDNLSIIRKSNLLSRLFFTIMDRPCLLSSNHDIIFSLISAICRPPCDDRSMLKLGQIISSTLPSSESELMEESTFAFSIDDLYNELMSKDLPSKGPPSRIYQVYIRNRLLRMIHTFLSHSAPSISSSLSEHIVKVLGFDWILALMAPKVHDGTVFVSLKLLLHVLSRPNLLHKFREGHGNGGWLSEADSVVRNSAATVLGFSLSSSNGGTIGSHIDIHPERDNCIAFTALEHILASHAHRPYVYLGMFSLLVGQPVKELEFINQFNVDIIWSHVFGLKGNSSVYDAICNCDFCYDALIVLFSIIRSCLYNEDIGDMNEQWRIQYPCTVIQVITFLYQNSISFYSVCHSEEFILTSFTSLISEYPYDDRSSPSSSPHINTTLPNGCTQSARSVIDLTKRIIMDEIQTNGNRNERLIDFLIETVSEYNGTNRKCYYITLSTLFNSILNDILSTDLLVSSSLPPHTSSLSSSLIHSNIFYLCSRITDSMWHSLITSSEPIRILNSFYEIHSIATQRGDNKLQLEVLLNGIMRSVLYILSRPIDNTTQQMAVLDTLSSLITKKYIFLQSNESWFYSSLSHIVFMLSVTPDILSNDNGQLELSSAQIAMAASRVWSDLLCSKKVVIEETFRRSSVTELNAARALLANAASQYWRSFVDGQLTRVVPQKPQLQQQISLKITQVASGLSRLPLLSRRSMSTTSSSSINKNELLTKVSCVSSEVVLLWLRVHSSLLRQLFNTQSIRYHEWHSHIRKWCLHEWSQLEAQLTRERAIWGPDESSRLDKFKLDTTEGSGRIRRLFIPNRSFYHDYPYRPYLEDPSSKALRAKVAISKDSKEYYEAQRRRRPKTIDDGIIEITPRVTSYGNEETNSPMDIDKIKSSLMNRVAIRENEERCKEEMDKKNEVDEEEDEDEMNDGDDKEDRGINDDDEVKDDKNNDNDKNEKIDNKKERRGPDNQTLLRLLEEGEELHSMFRCARVQGLETAEGLLLFGKENYYVVDGFTLLKTREIRDLDFLSADLHDPIVPYTATGASSPPRASKLCSKFSYNNIREVHKRRYLLQPIALEVFSADGRNYLLAFPKRMRDRVYDKFVSMAKGLRNGGNESVGGQRSNMAIELSGRNLLINSLIGQQSVTQRWLNGQISNFQYIMHLNTLAGRSYNDLSQYPVFPWVLSDYTSSTLDLSNPSSFRDFSKPMGAQSEDRLNQFLKRYNEWDDPTGDTPPYMYGTHYSSAMIVVSYLVRLEPFTQQFLSLQGGHFDLADRMFHSIGDAWYSASVNNMSDIKELIPEMFILPQMFINSNGFDLGTKQNGISLNNVVLPPWAKDDPKEFVRLHRMALESDYVSSNIHEWIDLIFGYKQNGEAAIQANNVFHHLFYEGNVDFESIDDPLTRNATIGFVNNFGQVPTQLFKKPHPQKKINSSLCDLSLYSSVSGVTTQRLFYHSLHSLKPPVAPIKELSSAIGVMQHNDKGVLQALPQNRLFLGSNKFVAWSFPDRSIRIGNIDSDKSKCVVELNDTSELTCATCGDERSLFVGSCDGCVTVWNISSRSSKLRRKKTLDGHSDAVTCLVVSTSHNIVASGSRDCSVIIWHLSQLNLIRQLPSHPSSISALAINDATGDIATGCGMQLFVWTMNGELLSTIGAGDSGPSETPHMILSIAFSTMNDWDGDNVIMCGSSDGVVSIFSCLLVQNDGSIEKPKLDSKKSSNSLSNVHSRLERQRRRLKVGGVSNDTGTSTSCSSRCHSPDGGDNRSNHSSISSISSNQNELNENKDGYVRVLIQRASLTTHTSFSRWDNVHPAPITAIIPSKDHKSLFIGDGVGRVWQWTMGEEVGGRSDHWVQDLARQRCTQCQHNFSIADRKHHCRNCGQIFCAKCSRFESHITHMKICRPVRVCQSCFVRLKAQTHT